MKKIVLILGDSAVAVTLVDNLPAHHVIHAVGPCWLDGTHNEDQLLYDTYKNTLLKADLIQAQTLSILSIHRFKQAFTAFLNKELLV